MHVNPGTAEAQSIRRTGQVIGVVLQPLWLLSCTVTATMSLRVREIDRFSLIRGFRCYPGPLFIDLLKKNNVSQGRQSVKRNNRFSRGVCRTSTVSLLQTEFSPLILYKFCRFQAIESFLGVGG